ncbi:MAG: hypothetical protein Q8S26_05500 [Azonexus sp.]|nr:hypothetical protein [Azonexus sp.]
MTLSAEIILSKDKFIADLSDGRRVEQPDFLKMAQALFQIGVRANHLYFDWRNGTKMITAGTQVAMVAEIRQLESAGRKHSKAA